MHSRGDFAYSKTWQDPAEMIRSWHIPSKRLPAPGEFTAPRKAPCIPGTLVKFSWEI